MKTVATILGLVAGCALVPAGFYAIGLVGHVGSHHHAGHLALAFAGAEAALLGCLLFVIAAVWVCKRIDL